MPTTPNGLRYPSPTDPPNGPLQMQQLAEDVDPWAKDTGWVNITPAAGVTVGTGCLRYRQVGKVVCVHVNVTANTVSGTILRLDSGGLPAAIRPPVTMFFGGYFSGYPGSVFIGNGGDITCVQNSGGNRAGVAGTLTYAIP